mgnify:CR=1 FL=1
MGNHEMLKRLQNGESIDLHEFTEKYDPVTKLILEKGGIFPFAKELKSNKTKEEEMEAAWAQLEEEK